MTAVAIVGSLMYLIEGPESGFTSIPVSMYWAIVTLTTVGYGDIAPVTVTGRLLASVLMILGYGIIRRADGHHDARDPAGHAGRRAAAGGVLRRLRSGRS